MLRRVNYRLRAEEARRSSEEPIVYGTAVAVGEVVACVTGVPVEPMVEVPRGGCSKAQAVDHAPTLEIIRKALSFNDSTLAKAQGVQHHR